MARTIDQIRASKLPSNMMQFAARGALQVSPAENIEILVYLARHNKAFGEQARMTLAGWDEKASRIAAGDPQTPAEVLDYFISPDNLRPRLLPALLENPSVSEGHLMRLALSASRESIVVMLKSPRVRSLSGVLKTLLSNPALEKDEEEELRRVSAAFEVSAPEPEAEEQTVPPKPSEVASAATESNSETSDERDDDGTVSAYINDHMHDIEAEGEKPFQAIGGIVDLLGENYFPVSPAEPAETETPPATAAAAESKTAVPTKRPPVEAKRENALQKISHLDVKGRIQLALKGNKEERSLLIRDGTKVVAFAVLEAPKLSDGEVEKFASQKNVLEAVLRQIPLKRRFMKNYIVVRNLVANPRTPLDLGLGLMKNLLLKDLKNLSANKEVSETIRNLAMKMYKQKLDAAAKK
jgi:hypothetical protein